MGAVYRARDLHFPNVTKIVAVKEMVNQARDPLVRSTIIRNFEREANILATLDHPSIPRIYDYFTHNECSYLILEFIHGKNLEVMLKDGIIPEDKLIRWSIELCDVLHYLHNHKPETIIFRDLKPSNIMVNHHDHVVLIDFGIAKNFESDKKGTMIGTEGYSPPEQYRGEATPLADIYALGATLHHLLSRRDPRLEPPFSFGERPIHLSNPSVSPELEEIIDTAIRYNPEERFPNSLAMKEALVKLAEKKGTFSKIPGEPIQTHRSEENINVLWTFESSDEIRGTATYHNGVIYVGSYDKRLYALNATSGKMIWEYASDGGIVSKPYIFEDNVYFGSEDQRLHVISLRSGRVNWTHFTGGPIRSSPIVAEGHVFIGSDDGLLHAVSVMTSRPVWQFDAGSPIRSTPLVLQESIYLGTENGDMVCLDFKGKAKWHFNAKRAITSSPTVSNGVIFFGSLDSTLYALDAKSGWMVWRYKLEKATISTPYIIEDTLITGSTDGYIYAIDARSAKELWRFRTEHQVTGSPVTYKDSVYCGSVDGNLYCLEYRTGRLRWKFSTDGPITGTPIIDNEVIYFGSTDHRFFALKTEYQTQTGS